MKSKIKYNWINILAIFLFLFNIYLLCTPFILMTYQGAYTEITENENYKILDSSVIEINNTQNKNSNVLYSVVFEVLNDSKKQNLSTEIFDIADDLKIEATSYVLSKTTSYDTKFMNNSKEEGSYILSNEFKDLKKGDSINFKVTYDNKLNTIDKLSAKINYDNNVLKPVKIYNNRKITQIQLSAFELLFGSQTSNDLHFDGNLYALIFWIPSIAGALAFIIDQKTRIKGFIGMVASSIGLAGIITMVGATRLCMGSMLSILIYLALFFLSVLSMFTAKE